jgi:hypothetical protein
MASVRTTPEGTFQVMYRDPAGRQRSRTFKRKTDATRFSSTVEADMLRGDWLDPRLSRMTVSECTTQGGHRWQWAGSTTSRATVRQPSRGDPNPLLPVNPAAVAAMAEVGIDIGPETPKRWTDDFVRAADVVVSMGCGDTCPVVPGTRYEDWVPPIPLGRASTTCARSGTRSVAASGSCSRASA